jgi:hypothetical protein
MSGGGGGGGEDRISILPDGVIGEIVTRLPTADAVRVQVLSRRWRHIWISCPLNLDLGSPNYYTDYKRVVSGILAAHPGPCRRLKVDWPYDYGESYNHWLQSPALVGLQELGIEPEYSSVWLDKKTLPRGDNTRALPERALFQFAPTLRLLRIGYHTFPFPSVGAVAALRLPHLELISLCCVDISEATLHGMLAACPVLRTLVLDGCTGFATVRINSPTITSFAISPADSSITNDYDPYFLDYDYENPTVRVTTWQVIIEDAPLLEKLVLCRRSAAVESFQLLVVSAPRIRVLGSLSFSIPKLEIGGTVFQPTVRRVNRVGPDDVIMEKRLLMQAVMLATTLRTVKILALEDADSIDVVSDYLKCFPCLEKLYISVSSFSTSIFVSSQAYVHAPWLLLNLCSFCCIWLNHSCLTKSYQFLRSYFT